MENQRSLVAVIPCDDYDEQKVYECLKRGIDALGGIGEFVDRDEKILVKPNLLSAADPDKAVTTHPSVLKGVLRILNEFGSKDVSFGDSPGHGSCEGALRALGMNDSNSYGARIVPMSDEVHVDFEDGIACKEFYFCKEVVESDAIINVCKMKTHALERVTGAVKNVYGFVCGFRKAAGHVKFPNDTVFARMVADIHRYTKPRLHIMDGIVAMEGNGPAAGVPVKMNVLLISKDPVALDTVFCYLVDLDPELIPTNSQGARMGIGTDSEDEIQIILCTNNEDENKGDGSLWLGDKRDGSPCLQNANRTVTRSELFELYGNPKFDVGREKPRKTFLLEYSGIMTRLSRRPVIDKSKCVKCGICVEHCPVPGKAVSFKNGKNEPPSYDYSKCIRCYCCQEMCPKHAIAPGQGIFGNRKGRTGIKVLLAVILLGVLVTIGTILFLRSGSSNPPTGNPTQADQTTEPSKTEITTETSKTEESASSKTEENKAEPKDADTSEEPVKTDDNIKTEEETTGEDMNKTEAGTKEYFGSLDKKAVPSEYETMRGLNATELVSELKCGWNLGNSLESLGSETEWGNPATTKEMIDAITAKGFNTIRIPVSWGQYTEKTENGYIIDRAFIERVGEVVDYAIENDMYVILNTHHETGWLIPTDKMIGDSYDKYRDIWFQIAYYFKDYGDHLIFEGLNEPRDEGGEKEWEGGTAENRRIISELLDIFVETVRSTGGNNEQRLLLITSEAACFMDSALKDVKVPDDKYVGVSIHAYTPYDFTFNHDGDYDDWDGSHKSDIQWTFSQINKYFLNKGIPVVMTEFGAERKGSATDNNDKEVVKWMRDYMTFASKYKVPVVIWDNNLVNGNGERFGLLNRRTLTWDREEIVDTLINGYKPE
ncbi:MAG: cellulase family glycosylhydrolase [Lachnospiraceae bacterium]|nr:cellulase family glycosylhydrolase [Lachnospiraceae bacterium]